MSGESLSIDWANLRPAASIPPVSAEIIDVIALLLRHADNGLTVAEANEDEFAVAMIRSRFALFIARELAAGRHRGEADKQAWWRDR